MTANQSTPTISEKIDDLLDSLEVKEWTMAWDEKQGKPVEVNPREIAYTKLLKLLANFAKRITPEKMDRWSTQGTMKTELDAWNRCVNTITQNVKAELGAAKDKETGL